MGSNLNDIPASLDELEAAVVRHVNGSSGALKLSARLVRQFGEGTAQTLVQACLLSDFLRIAADAIYADGVISGAELRASYPLLRKCAALFCRYRASYKPFEDLQLAETASFLKFYRSDSATLGYAADETRWAGLEICCDVARVCGDWVPLDLYELLSLKLTQQVMEVDGISPWSQGTVDRIRQMFTDCREKVRKAEAVIISYNPNPTHIDGLSETPSPATDLLPPNPARPAVSIFRSIPPKISKSRVLQIICAECHQQVSAKCSACPECGFPIDEEAVVPARRGEIAKGSDNHVADNDAPMAIAVEETRKNHKALPAQHDEPAPVEGIIVEGDQSQSPPYSTVTGPPTPTPTAQPHGLRLRQGTAAAHSMAIFTIILVLFSVLDHWYRTPDVNDLARRPDGKAAVQPQQPPPNDSTKKIRLVIWSAVATAAYCAYSYLSRKRSRSSAVDTIINCPNCSRTIGISQQWAGQQVECPSCQRRLHVSGDGRQLITV